MNNGGARKDPLGNQRGNVQKSQRCTFQRFQTCNRKKKHKKLDYE